MKLLSNVIIRIVFSKSVANDEVYKSVEVLIVTRG